MHAREEQCVEALVRTYGIDRGSYRLLDIEWCEGRTQVGNGVKNKWTDLIAFFENEE